jgi:hypothetical protein
MKEGRTPEIDDLFAKNEKHTWSKRQKQKVILRVVIIVGLLLLIISLNIIYANYS